MNETILVIDDNEKLCKSLGLNFKQMGFDYHYRLNSDFALGFLSQKIPHLILLDLALGDEDGLNVLTSIKRLQPAVPVIMITGYGSIDSAVMAMKIGAADYVQKPLHFPNLHKIIENTLRRQNKKADFSENGIVTKSQVMKDLLQKAKKMARTDFPVLIIGESGTGKEHVAHYIHDKSLRSKKRMQCINCAAFPENLLDNELFGHEKGAYTGADNQFKGIFERAHSGSLFMDEIGDMSLQTQAKILRTLQNNEIRRIGGDDIIKIEVRFIGATNKKLDDLMEQKKFREDLYYRLSTAVIEIPPLRERKEDILPLAEYFLAESLSQKSIGLSAEVIDVLLQHNWPGNIRELRNAVHYAGAMAAGNEIKKSDLPQGLNQSSISVPETGSLEDYEKTLILKVLMEVNNNKKRAAEILNISRKTLYNKLEKFGITGV